MDFDVSESESAGATVGFDRSLLLKPIRGGNTYEETVERILQTIRLGLIHPGEQLPPERELATMLEISRDTVRDAIASLSEAGYLSSRRGRYGGNSPKGNKLMARKCGKTQPGKREKCASHI